MPETRRSARDSLAAHLSGDPQGAAELLPLVYRELRALAGEYMKAERRDHSLTPTAVVHEAYLRLIGNTRTNWRGQAHFLAMAAIQMRRVLVDHARSHDARKRGGGRVRITLDERATLQPGLPLDVLALSEALEKLGKLNSRQARVVELRFFGGLSVRETAEYLNVSERTVKEDWRIARAWLRRELG